MKTRLLKITCVSSINYGKIKSKEWYGKTSERATNALRIIAGPETVADCRDLPEMWRHCAAAETGGAMPEQKTIFFFWYMS